MDKEYAKYLFEKTRQDYNLIAEDFSRTRNFISQDLRVLGEYTLPGEKVLDLGCGNARFFEVLKEKKADYYGVDNSENLIAIAKKKYPKAKFQIAEALNLPFPNNFFDKVYSLAVLHHIPSKNFRLSFLKEVKRILKPGGLLILKVWDLWKREEGLKLIFKYTFLKLIGKSKLDFGDIFLPWRNSQGKILASRYYHCFKKREMENLVKETGFKIKESFFRGEKERIDICLVSQKPS